jgi:protein-disulfide isomerase
MSVANALIAFVFLSGVVCASDVQNLSKADREAIISGVVSYFKEHPDQIVEAIMNWRSQGGANSELVSSLDPISGNFEGDVTIIEFIDMGCAPCRTMSSRIASVAAADKGIRVVSKDYPVSGADSVHAARQLLMASYIDDTRTKMAKLLVSGSRFDRKAIDDAAAESISGSVTPIVLDRVNKTLERNRKLAATLGIKELPATIVMSGSEMKVMTGLQTDADIAASVASLRAKR